MSVGINRQFYFAITVTVQRHKLEMYMHMGGGEVELLIVRTCVWIYSTTNTCT